MKDEGGIIALTQDSDALLRWAVAGLELIRVTSEFGASIVGKREGSSQINHHATQRLFVKQLNSLVDIIDVKGNPFDEESSDMLRLQYSHRG